jgi:hypothetical protein
MNTLKHLLLALVAASMLGLSSCGGGTQVAEGGIGGSGISSGSISGFGSVIVNGVEFNTDNARFSKDGDTAVTQDNLAIGMVVTIQGKINADGVTGTADSVSYLDLLEGPVKSVGTSSFVAMGQTVLVDSSTVFAGPSVSSLADLAEGKVVEVSGFFTAQPNVIHATYVELTNSIDHEVKGIVTAVDKQANQLAIAGLVVTTSEAGSFSQGDFVEAKGVVNGQGALDATEVTKLNKGLDLKDADEAELEGLVTSDCGTVVPCTFQIGFVPVQVSASTEFDGGGHVADILQGARVEVEGKLVNGVIEAREIQFKDGIELFADVAAKGTDTVTLEYGDTDLTVQVDSGTDFKSFDNGFDGIQVGPNNHVAVRARDLRGSGGGIKAVSIENKSDDNNVVLQGPVDSENGDVLTIMGISFNLRAMGNLSYRAGEDQSLSLTQFLDAVQEGDVVRLTGQINSGGIDWSQITIRN